DDGDASIDPFNMTLRQIMKKIDDQLGMHGSCDITPDGKLILRTAQGGPGSSVELASIDDAFFEFLFGTDPLVKNGANEPTHGYYRSGVPYSATDTIALPPGFEMNILINSTTDSPASITVGGFAAGMGIIDIVDHINQACMSDPAISLLVLPSESNAFNFASVVNSNGEQLYPPLPGQASPDNDVAMYLKIQSHTWGTGSNIKIENTAAQPPADFAAGMAELFGKGTINAPVIMGGVDGIEQEMCMWLDVADAQLGNLNRIWTDLGARMNRGELTQDRLDMDGIVAEMLLAETESVDEAKTIMLLQIAETVYSASLAVGARVIQPSLLDFLR
ncbi:MAG: hypothetical protein FWH01_16785, partial [Oscillospiraceae bacterium]|nr:hypothetical protein [Oscillospiraceae bacterium]